MCVVSGRIENRLTTCSSEKVRRFGGKYRLNHQGRSKKSATFAAFLLGLLLNTELGGMFFRNVGRSLNYTSLQSRSPYSSFLCNFL
jgi:hypothetical protein